MRATAPALFLIVMAIVIAYANSFSGPFLFDDYHNIIGNKNMQVADLSFASLRKAAVEGPSKHRWLPKLSFALNYYFADKKTAGYHSDTASGLGFVEPESWGYHLVNVLIHTAAALCLYFLFRLTLVSKLLQRDFTHVNEAALLAAVIWAVHPVGTNGVTYIVQRMTSMATLFFISSVLFYALGRRQYQSAAGRSIFFLLSLASGLLAMVSKENSAMLPVIILGYEFYFLGGSRLFVRHKTSLFVPVAAVLLVVGLGWIYVGGNPFASFLGGYGSRDFTLVERLLTQPRVIVQYLSLLVVPLPSRLNLAYDFPVSTAIISPLQTLPALLVIVTLVFLLFFLFRRDRLLSFAIFWFLANLAIESSFIPLEIIFEHRVYLPAMFLVLILVCKGYEWGKHRLRIVRVLFTVLALLLVFFTWQRNQTWASRENVWGDVAVKAPNLTRGHMGLYVTYKAQNRNAEALEALEKAVEVGPEEFRPSFNLANYYKEEKQYKQALLVLNNMLQTENLRTAPAYQLRASIYLERKNYQMAIGDALKAIDVDPGHVNSLLILGSAYFRLNNFEQAAKYFEKARELVPDTYGVYFNLGTTYYNLGAYDRAIENYRRALGFMPGNADIHYSLGMVYGAKGMVKEMQEEMAISRQLKGGVK